MEIALCKLLVMWFEVDHALCWFQKLGEVANTIWGKWLQSSLRIRFTKPYKMRISSVESVLEATSANLHFTKYWSCPDQVKFYFPSKSGAKSEVTAAAGKKLYDCCRMLELACLGSGVVVIGSDIWQFRSKVFFLDSCSVHLVDRI